MALGVHDTAGRLYAANLSLLSASSRAALSAGAGPDVSAEPPDFVLKVSTPAGRLVPMHPSGDPAAAAAAAVARLSADGPPPLIVIIGLGAGYLLDALDAAGNTTTKILAIEPVPAMTRLLLMRRDCRAWLSSGRLTLLVGPDYAGAPEAWRAFGPDVVKPPTIMAPLVDQHFPADAAQAKAVLRQILTGVQANAEARRQLAGRYLINTLKNLPSVVVEGDAGALTGAFPGIPAVVVGAGPSLDANLRTIEVLQHRAIIIAVDTALRPLVATGIRPHLVVAVDPSELNARHLQNLPNVSDVWLVAEGSLDSSVFQPFVGRTFTFRVSQHHPWPWLSQHGVTRATLRAWGSVLTTCFDLACRMGCGPIVFAGADLAYSHGLQYCRNTTYEPDWRDCPDDRARAERFKKYLATRPHQPEPDVHGGAVLTSPPYVQFRDWIVARAGELQDQQVWNMTGAGILHGGVIAQVDDVESRLAEAPVVATPDRRLRASWDTRPSQADAMQRLDTALSTADAVPFDEWQAFAGATVTAETLRLAIDDTARQIRAQARASVTITRDLSRAEARMTTRETTMALMHPRYEYACAQAPAQQAHVLLDVMQRTYKIDGAQPSLDVVEAATRVSPGLRVLDVGCGLGRTMLPLVEAGYLVDGVDVSARVIDLAREDPRLAASSFFVSNGMDCGGAPAGTYDLVTSLNAFHQVRPRVARLALLQAMAQTLRPGGVIAIQMPFFPDRTAASIAAPHVPWSADESPDVTNPGAVGEVQCTPDELSLIYQDFTAVFHDVAFRFVDFPSTMPRFGLASRHRLSHLVVTASNDYALAARMYAGPQG